MRKNGVFDRKETRVREFVSGGELHYQVTEIALQTWPQFREQLPFGMYPDIDGKFELFKDLKQPKK